MCQKPWWHEWLASVESSENRRASPWSGRRGALLKAALRLMSVGSRVVGLGMSWKFSASRVYKELVEFMLGQLIS
eukprot:1160451-Pelagomonas_calceolata.AAC.21